MKRALVTLLALLLITVVQLSLTGCSEEQEELIPGPDPDQEDLTLPDLEDDELIQPDDGEDRDVEPDRVQLAPDYFWLWLQHGILSLSSGEEIFGPDLFESDLGFIKEFTPGDSFRGELFWIADYSDVFALQSLTLLFDVDYFENYEYQHTVTFEFDIDRLTPEPGDDGLQVLPLQLTDEEPGLRVNLWSLTLGKEQESSFTTDPISYIAVEIEVIALD